MSCLCQAASPEDWASGCLIFGGGTIGIQVWCGVNFILLKGKVQSNKKNEQKKQHTFALERKKFEIASQIYVNENNKSKKAHRIVKSKIEKKSG